MQVGQVIPVGLSQDARHVDIRARILQKHAPLISTNSVFWASSGVDLDISLSSGLKLNAESLETIARGGVSLLTIAGGGDPVQPGHIFSLHPKAEDDWYEKAATVRSTNIDLHGAFPLEAKWKQNSFLGTSTRSTTFMGLPIKTSTESYLLCPTDIIAKPKRAIDDTFRIVFQNDEVTELDLSALPPLDQQLVKVPVDSQQIANWITTDQFRTPEQVEDCLAVRATPEESGGMTFLHFPIEAPQIGKDWSLREFNGDRKIWHGAPVLSAADGMVLGVLLVGETDSRVVLFSPISPISRTADESLPAE